MKLKAIDEREWATIQGLLELFSMFDVATKHLSGEKYSSFTTALPLLRKIKRHLCDESLFDFSSTCCLDSNFKNLFQDSYGSCIFLATSFRSWNFGVCCYQRSSINGLLH
jgi:hypothetical protein